MARHRNAGIFLPGMTGAVWRARGSFPWLVDDARDRGHRHARNALTGRSWAASQRERSANRTYCARVDVVRALGQRLVAGPRQQQQTPRPGRRPGGCAAASAARAAAGVLSASGLQVCLLARLVAPAAKAVEGHSETRRFQHETTWKRGMKTSLLARAGAPSRRPPTTCGRRSPPTPSTTRARPRSRRSTVRAFLN